MGKRRNKPTPAAPEYQQGLSKSAAMRRELREIKAQAGRLVVLCGMIEPLNWRKRVRTAYRILRTGSIV